MHGVSAVHVHGCAQACWPGYRTLLLCLIAGRSFIHTHCAAARDLPAVSVLHVQGHRTALLMQCSVTGIAHSVRVGTGLFV